MTIDIDDFKARLLARREEVKELAEIAHEDTRPVELDQSRVGRLSRMDALQVQAMAVETERRRQAELARIDRALAFIEKGEYGYCQSCGTAIPERRLALDLATMVCIDCAKDTS